ncbi:hypothetical protein BJ508DRAFT_316042 [Ascobolus immersus RN42]|uniref:Uncharacterized protein n=1 Tax=Ascobolus immersus RN42 TaxID=1160509 RepID=A0A3N4H827_ASCIM|nr:hypothetical protein BJ508DRAFT_316042 [Ascobolus immersus RN42]
MAKYTDLPNELRREIAHCTETWLEFNALRHVSKAHFYLLSNKLDVDRWLVAKIKIKKTSPAPNILVNLFFTTSSANVWKMVHKLWTYAGIPTPPELDFRNRSFELILYVSNWEIWREMASNSLRSDSSHVPLTRRELEKYDGIFGGREGNEVSLVSRVETVIEAIVLRNPLPDWGNGPSRNVFLDSHMRSIVKPLASNSRFFNRCGNHLGRQFWEDDLILQLYWKHQSGCPMLTVGSRKRFKSSMLWKYSRVVLGEWIDSIFDSAPECVDTESFKIYVKHLRIGFDEVYMWMRLLAQIWDYEHSYYTDTWLEFSAHRQICRANLQLLSNAYDIKQWLGTISLHKASPIPNLLVKTLFATPGPSPHVWKMLRDLWRRAGFPVPVNLDDFELRLHFSNWETWRKMAFDSQLAPSTSTYIPLDNEEVEKYGEALIPTEDQMYKIQKATRKHKYDRGTPVSYFARAVHSDLHFGPQLRELREFWYAEARYFGFRVWVMELLDGAPIVVDESSYQKYITYKDIGLHEVVEWMNLVGKIWDFEQCTCLEKHRKS